MLASRITRAGIVLISYLQVLCARITPCTHPRRRRRRSSADVVKGVCFDEQVVDGVPTESHDSPLDFVLTPTRTFRRGEESVGT